jgi:hypothetical protein
MPLSAALEELLKTLPADVQAQQRAILEKHPSLGEGWLRQSDYDRFMNANKSKIEKVDEVERWYNDNKPKFDTLKTNYAQLEADKAKWEAEKLKLEADLQAASAAAAAAKAAEGSNVDPQKIAEAVRTSLDGKIPTSTELAKLISEETKKQATSLFAEARKNFYEHDFKETASWITGMNDVMWRYRDEFGKTLDRVAFSKFMSDNKIVDPVEAYDRFTASDREEKKFQSRLEEEKKKWEAEHKPAEGIPGMTPPGGMGHLQVRLNKHDEKDPLFSKDFELGDNTAASEAAKEWRAELGSRA